MKPWCVICGSEDGLRLFAITIDGEPLRLRFHLCSAHGEKYLLRLGTLIGEMLREGVL